MAPTACCDQLSASLESRANLEQQLAGLRADYASAQSELSSLKSRSAADKEAIDRQLKEIADLSGDVAALKALKEELEKEVSALSFRASEAESKRAELAKSLESVKTERDGLAGRACRGNRKLLIPPGPSWH